MSKHNVNLDILRGVAASIVVYRHLSDSAPSFDAKHSVNNFFHYYPPGVLAVLVFFIMSGYVIGYNHPWLNSKELIYDYIKKRLVRIVPIYFVAILFTAIVTHGVYGWKIYLSNLFFISVPADNVIWEASPLWSLQYELLYYFVFILFSYYRVNLGKTIMLLLLLIGVLFAGSHYVTVHPLIISVLVGFLFWITGVLIAQKFTSYNWNISHSRILSVFILIFCLVYFNPYNQVLKLLRLHEVDYSAYSWDQQSLSYNHLFYYPLAIVLILALIHGYSKYSGLFIAFLFTCALGRLVSILIVYNRDFLVKEGYIFPSIVLLSSVVLWLLNCRFDRRIVKVMKSVWPLSMIAYALYIIHKPLLHAFGHFNVSSEFGFVLKLLAYVLTLLLISYCLEVRFQRWVKGFFFKKRKVRVAEPAG